MKNNSPFASKKDALTAAIQAGAARDYAVAKTNRQFKRPKSEKKAYKPGNIGPSVIATAIKHEYGRIISRRSRKYIAKIDGQPFQKFYAWGERMKRGKKPTLFQKKAIAAAKVPTPDDWLVRYQNSDRILLVHKHARNLTKTIFL